MTPAQKSLYWREWGKTRARLISDGLTSEQAAAKRHALHVKALGRDKSHTSFTNADFDKVLGVFRAVHDDANLDAQLRQIDMPEQRREDMVTRCWRACTDYTENDDPEFIENYLNKVAARICKTPGMTLEQCTDAQLGKVMGTFERRRETKKTHDPHAEPPHEDNPF